VLTKINGLDTYYQDEGQGEPVVLLHGWGVSSQSLVGVASSLAARFRVLSVDLPGFGWSRAPADAWGTAQYADHIRQLLDALGLSRVALLGHSFGGRVAISLAAQHPARASRLILVASAGVRPRQTRAVRAKVAATKLLRRVVTLPGWGRLGERILRRWQDRMGSRDYRAAGAMRPTLVRVVNEDLVPMLPLIQAPTLLLWGDQDREVRRPAVDTMAARIPGARLVVFPGAGHFPFQDAPEEFQRHLTGFLRSEDRC
jgi:pimeloyl-ACP methyl ester carboxylesterase